mmetsp:Transcript_53578/g.117127  ORF Transcript_53578/g.117127 Transcript_53578/m.117127 type:complete len:283 (-) Transcript_53578:96-944(-)
MLGISLWETTCLRLLRGLRCQRCHRGLGLADAGAGTANPGVRGKLPLLGSRGHQWRQGGPQLLDAVDVGENAIVLDLPPGVLCHVGFGLRTPLLRIAGIKGTIHEIHAALLELRDEHGLGANTLLIAHVTPEALIHEQRPGDARGLSCAQGFHSSAQSPMDDKAIHQREENAKIHRFGFTEGPRIFALLSFAFQINRPLLNPPNVHDAHVELAFLDQLEDNAKQSSSRHWHATEGNQTQWSIVTPGIVNETSDRLAQVLPCSCAGCTGLLSQENKFRLNDVL